MVTADRASRLIGELAAAVLRLDPSLDLAGVLETVPLDLHRAARAWSLSPLEADILGALVLSELAPELSAVWSKWGGDPMPSADQLAQVLGWPPEVRLLVAASLDPVGALTAQDLVVPLSSVALRTPLRLQPGVAVTVAGLRSPPEPGPAEDLDDLDLDPDVRAAALRAAACLDRRRVVVSGPAGSGREALAAAIARRAGLEPWRVGSPGDGRGLSRDVRWWGAAALLGPVRLARAPSVAAPHIVITDALDPDAGPDTDAEVVRLTTPTLGQRARWWGASREQAEALGLAYRYRFGPRRIRALRDAVDVDAAVRAGAPDRLGALAHRVPPIAGRSALVAAPEVWRELDLALAWIRHGPRVFSEWGVDPVGAGRGLLCLFHGPPGTGKSLAARILAHEAGLPLYRIDLSQVMDKYIGETEKHLDRLFDAAEDVGAMLLFDEADAVFGRRSEVHDAKDRYANVETAYLLQKVELHSGPVALSTNLVGNLDEAFQRRLHAIVAFEMPAPADRALLWRLHLPSRTGEVDVPFLADRFAFSGGDIRNVVVAASLLAAAEGQEIGMSHVIPAVVRELRKSGRMIDPARFGRWREHVRTGHG